MTQPKQKVSSKITETDLFIPIRDFLVNKGYTVHSEVKNCDIAAVKDDQLLVVELKINFNATLLIQAAKRQRVANLVYIAIPMPKTGLFSRHWKDLCYLVRRLELGLIVVSFLPSGPRAEVIFDPKPFDREQSQRLNKKNRGGIISEINGRHGDYNIGGSTRQKIMTAYKENAVQILCYLYKYGPLTIGRLKELGTGPKTGVILQKNFYGWFDRVAKGSYQITSEGIKSLADYPEIVAYYLEELNQS
ncbi:MAG: hypothetical protein GXY86_12935 [Firmicutes bacterium]|nr:hypothetical protein [Bacillota bacterium]